MPLRYLLQSAQSYSALNSVGTTLRIGPLYQRFILGGVTGYSREYDALPITSLLPDLWESILRAVPKKKTSHMKKRHRQMAGKALKDVKNLSTCSSCGEVKRSHVLCKTCVTSKRLQSRLLRKLNSPWLANSLTDIKKQWKTLRE